jgi:hypothetical protein
VTSLHDYAIRLGLVSTPAETDALSDLAVGMGVAFADLAESLAKSMGSDPLEGLGLTVRAPIIPHPVPPPELLARLSAMYGDSPAAQGAAYRTGEAMERRRQGWTRQGARDEWQRRMLENFQASTTGLA